MRLRRCKLFRSPRPRIVRRCARLLGILWASPITLFGLLLALPVICWRGKIERIVGGTGALLVRGPLADWMLGHHPFGSMSAMALGHVVIAEQQGLSVRILVHELAHVRQAMRWGPVFPLAYLASSAWAALRGQDAYWHNVFEIAAREAEKHVGREQAYLD
jgi:Zn-dependent protease